MKIRIILRFICWNLVPILMGAIVFYYLNKVNGPGNYMETWLMFFIVAFPAAIIYTWVGGKIFKEKMTLAKKMMTCKLRMKHGYDYCVKCPDSYTCPTDIKI